MTWSIDFDVVGLDWFDMRLDLTRVGNVSDDQPFLSTAAPVPFCDKQAAHHASPAADESSEQAKLFR